MAAGEYSVEHARSGDLQGILDILNHYILGDHCTFDTKPWTVKQKQQWFDGFDPDGPYRLIVARHGANVLGYTSSTRWRPKKASEVTAETTVYVHPEHLGKGLGRQLLGHLLDHLAESGLHSVVAGVAQPNAVSNHLHELMGFEVIGTYREVGFKFERYWDVTWYQKRFN